MAAIWVIVIGILRLVRSFKLRRFHKALNTQIIARHWWVVMINGILLIAVGIIGLMNPAMTAVAIGTLMGWHVVIAEINLISTAWAA